MKLFAGIMRKEGMGNLILTGKTERRSEIGDNS